MSVVVGIDPGPTRSAWATYPDRREPWEPLKIRAGIVATSEIYHHLPDLYGAEIAIEMIASYGMPVGREVFETCVWIGRLIEQCARASSRGREPALVYRKDVKLHICGSPKAKDGNIRQALIDRFGPPGTKKSPGVTYGLAGDMWQALAVAVYHHDTAAAARPPLAPPEVAVALLGGEGAG